MHNTRKLPDYQENNLIRHFQEKLDMLNQDEQRNDFISDIWRFRYSIESNYYQTSELDFSIIDYQHIRFHKDNVTIEWDLNRVTISIKDYIKIVFISLAAEIRVRAFKRLFIGLTHLQAFLTERQIIRLEDSDYKLFYEYMISIKVSKSGAHRRHIPLHYCNAIDSFNFLSIYKLNRELGTKLLATEIGKKKREAAIKSAVETATDLTLADYKAGGSHNYLTLDIGRHYMDFSAKFFNDNIVIASAIKNCIDNTKTICALSKKTHTSTTKILIKRILSGHSNEKIIQENTRYRAKRGRTECSTSIPALNTLREAVKLYFNKCYKVLAKRVYLFDDSSLQQICKYLELPHSPELYESIRGLLTAYQEPKDYALEKLLANSLSGYELTKPKHLDITGSITKLERWIENKYHPPQLTKHFYESINIEPHTPKSEKWECSQYLELVEACGVTIFSGLTGWRASEYGFCLDDVKVIQNLDTLDSPLNPLQIEVKSHVFKTNGQTKLNRPICLSAYLILKKMDQLVGAERQLPALYSFHNTSNKRNLERSSSRIQNRVKLAWPKFVKEYKFFVDIRKLDYLKYKANKSTLSKSEKKELDNLSASYPDSIKTDQIRSVCNKVTKELSRLEAFKYFSNTDYGSSVISEYRDEKMIPTHKEIWDSLLTDELKITIKSNRYQKTSKFPEDLVRAVRNRILADCAYPTPHAIRHMWAEAVYRRYSGDVGWFIRTNFKHLSRNFFMRYLRNKDNSSLNTSAKRYVVSAILQKHLLSQRAETRKYTGVLDRYLTKLGAKTVLLSPEKLSETIKEYASNEIYDIQSNSFGYCILRNRNMNNSKCAEIGTPQRQNAAPNLCLGCHNNLIEEGHISGLMILLENDVKIVKNPKLPKQFKNASVLTIRKAINELKKMDINSKSQDNVEFINYLQNSLREH